MRKDRKERIVERQMCQFQGFQTLRSTAGKLFWPPPFAMTNEGNFYQKERTGKAKTLTRTPCGLSDKTTDKETTFFISGCLLAP